VRSRRPPIAPHATFPTIAADPIQVRRHDPRLAAGNAGKNKLRCLLGGRLTICLGLGGHSLDSLWFRLPRERSATAGTKAAATRQGNAAAGSAQKAQQSAGSALGGLKSAAKSVGDAAKQAGKSAATRASAGRKKG
jgi:hypothetical protein